MGIDVYLRWDGQTEEESQAQFTGFSVVHGHVGYLREAFHGEPYVTEFLFPEGMKDDSDGEGVSIPATSLRQRLPEALRIADERERKVYNYDPNKTTKERKEIHAKTLKSFEDFVALAEKLEAEGKNPRILVS